MNHFRSNPGRTIVWLAVAVLFIAHQDFWWWGDRTLLLGFMPVGLAYHAVFSLAAGLVWLCACKFAWPEEIEAWAGADDSSSNAAEEKQ